jgi:hypothetical protein
MMFLFWGQYLKPVAVPKAIDSSDSQVSSRKQIMVRLDS